MRQAPQQNRHWIGDKQQRWGNHDQQQVLDHVHEEKLLAERIDGRKEGQGNTNEAGPIADQAPHGGQRIVVCCLTSLAGIGRAPAQAPPSDRVQVGQCQQGKDDFEPPIPAL